MTEVKWGRSEDGYVDSKCGEFSIVPLYGGCVNPQWYELRRNGKRFDWFDTQRDAKAAAERIRNDQGQ